MKLPLILASALTLLPASTLPVQSVPPASGSNAESDLVGTYQCQGTRADGAAYRGTVNILRHNGTYHVVWTFGPRERYLGIGIASGNVLAVSTFGGAPGVVVYRIEQADKGPRLVGQWTVVDANGEVFIETLTRLTKDVSQPAPTAPRPSRVLPWRSLRSV